jgi:hypothetical protein
MVNDTISQKDNKLSTDYNGNNDCNHVHHSGLTAVLPVCRYTETIPPLLDSKADRAIRAEAAVASSFAKEWSGESPVPSPPPRSVPDCALGRER